MLGKSFEAQNTVPLISKYNIIILLNGRRKFCGFISILSFKVFTANKDRDTVVYHKLTLPRKVRYIRVIPWTWHNHISMRMELYGCLGNLG